MSIFSNKAGDAKAYGNNGTQESKELSANNSSDNSDDTEDATKYELGKKLDEESGEEEHGPAADSSAQEVRDSSEVQEEVSENTDIPRDDETANDVDICGSELKPTPLPSFGGLANVDVCAEEINPRLTESELIEDHKDLESHDVQNSPINQFPESLIETASHVDFDIGKGEMSDDENTEEPESYGQIDKSEQEVSEITDTFIEDTESTERVHLEESTERTNDLDITENSITSEAGQGTEEHIEEKDEILDNEDQELTLEYSRTNDVEDEPAGETTGMKDTYIEYNNETYDSKSEIIDVLDEVVMSSEHEAGNNTDEHSTSKIMEEEELLESHTHAPDSQLSDTDDVTGNEILNTDVIDTSEKDPITENVNEASDLDSDCCDAEEMDRDDVNKDEEDQTKSTTFDDLPSMHEQDMKTGDVTNDSELKDVLASETEREAEVITDESHIEAQNEQTEHLETGKDEEDHFEDHKNKNHASNDENPKSSEEQVGFILIFLV